MILRNNLLFSIILSFIITLLFYIFSNKSEKDNDKNNIVLLFGVSFISSFLLKNCIGKTNVKSTENILTYSSRPPF